MTTAVTDSFAIGVAPDDVVPLNGSGLQTRAAGALSPPGAASGERPATKLEAPAFREIYEAHVEMVWRTLRRAGVPASSVDDVAQEVFLTIHRALPTWQGRSSLRTWVYRIAHNAGLNHARGVRRRPDGAPTETADASPHASADPESGAASREAIEVLAEILARIEPVQREVLVLMDLEGFSAPELAALMAVPLNTVYSRLRLARAELERLLADDPRDVGAA